MSQCLSPPTLFSVSECLALKVLRPPMGVIYWAHLIVVIWSTPSHFFFFFFLSGETELKWEWQQAAVFREAEDLHVLGPLSLPHPTDPLPFSEVHLPWSRILPCPNSRPATWYLCDQGKSLNVWTSVFFFCKLGACSEDVLIGAQTADEFTKEVNSALSPDPSRAVCQTGKGDAGRWKQPNNNKECEEAGSCRKAWGIQCCLH